MNPKRFFFLAFCIGLLALAWVGYSFVGTSWLAFAMTVVIAVVYLAGAHELRQFRAATGTLRTALDNVNATPASLPEWLEQVPAPLHATVRARIEGERAALPGPSLTPYLVGLLVMLGMLGTFLGMVVTFKGAVFALEGSTDLQAIRAALAEPIRGLGLSFGTSVAGVAASAMLGLMSTIARRERVDAARLLDSRIAGALLPFSLAHHRQETLRAMQAQIRTLPEVALALQGVMDRIERRSEQLDAQLLERHTQLQREVTGAYTELARQVGTHLNDSLAASARATGDTVKPIVEQAMAQLVGESQRLQQRIGDIAQTQARERAENESRWLEEQRKRMGELSALWHSELGSLRQEESQRGDAAVQRLSELQGAVAQHLATLGAALEAPITRLLHTASEVPQAAAGVIAQLREEMSSVTERDNLALQERTLLLERLGALVGSLEQAAGEQRTAIEAMVASATSVLEQSQQRFTQALDAQAAQAAEASTQATASAVELAAVADSFGESVRLFQVSHEKLTDTLQRVEATMQKSTARSDEQLAYYVAQAREVIDLSIASQQGLMDSLRQLQQGKGKPAPMPESVA
ncbi:hypothetical protein [Ramlibacter humi]|uniref:DUF802 domain-containing protein n=1 Tax=Ramlibacter humi TaxID=2530451 RepID=A0A4Z0CEL3_9BURK|nr:hypothetical protein [Ramlibacter humi]TFZ08895.1 hypothetical protein EZ216_07065 [Ramlibacter humi]